MKITLFVLTALIALLVLLLAGCASPETYSYSDGSGNAYTLQNRTLSYDPVTPLESSSGEYDGGKAATVDVTPENHDALVHLFDAAMADTSDHIKNRVKMSGYLQAGNKTVILDPDSKRKEEIEALLKSLLEGPPQSSQ